jgi:hypothetical protein
MWNVKTKVTAEIIMTTGTFRKSFRKYLNNIIGEHNVRTTQNSHTGHCEHIAKNTKIKVQTFIMGKNITCTVQHTVTTY